VEIINQLGALFLAAVPTVIIVFLFYFFLRWSFFNPIQLVLAERHKRAEGARAEAEAIRTAAHEKQRMYNEALKKARAEIFTEQESLRRRALDERQATINKARASAQAALQEAKKGVEAEVKAARTELERSSEALATDIADAILAGLASGPGGSQGKRAR
jgi:F0F1-type ATP synthase membrane subunit b/b'